MSKTPKNFKQKLDELEAIVEWFESSEVDFDQALERFETGLALAAELKKQLDQVENRVIEIKRKFEAVTTESTESDTATETSTLA
ncbi:MAG: exodeoxyribonuclease VII small subunit [Candidatus Saccharimonadales bacterium]